MSEEIKKKRLTFLPNGKGYTEEEDSMYKKTKKKNRLHIPKSKSVPESWKKYNAYKIESLSPIYLY